MIAKDKGCAIEQKVLYASSKKNLNFRRGFTVIFEKFQISEMSN